MIGSRLRAVLNEKGLTIAELARRANIKRESISLVASGKRHFFSRWAAPRVFTALAGEIPLNDLLGIDLPTAASPRKPRAKSA